jgi:hypothetical protein
MSGAAREKLISQLMAIDAPTAEKYIDLFSARWTRRRSSSSSQRNDRIMQLMGGLTQLPLAERKAAIQQEMPQLQELGYTPEQIAQASIRRIKICAQKWPGTWMPARSPSS